MTDKIKHTAKWLEEVVIGLDFCPFAKREWRRRSIRFTVLEGTGMEALLRKLLAECQVLDEDDQVETTLIILPDCPFGEYLDQLAVAEAALLEMGYEGVYQLASFHPDYLFEGSPADDPAHFTNRSPYPTLHLLREDSIAEALTHYPDPADIPERNIRVAREKGAAFMKRIFLESFEG